MNHGWTITKGAYLVPFKTREYKTIDDVIEELELPKTYDTFARVSRSIYYYCKKGILIRRNKPKGKHQYYKLSEEIEVSS